MRAKESARNAIVRGSRTILIQERARVLDDYGLYQLQHSRSYLLIWR